MSDLIEELVRAEVDDNGAQDVDDLPRHVRQECIAHHLDDLVGEDLPAALEFMAEEPSTAQELHLLAHVVHGLKHGKAAEAERAIGQEILRRAENYYRGWLDDLVKAAVSTKEPRQLRKQRDSETDAAIKRAKEAQ